MPGRFRPRGEMMRDCSKNRAGFDRVLMAVAATFLTVSAASALAQSDPAHKSAAELAIDAAVPPTPVHPERHDAVDQLIAAGDGIEHLAHGLDLLGAGG